ncbi:hypothetical protein [Clostridium sp.]|jgi:putative transposase|uniref:hypothetical protein n=1 Tax=Clostridium sp. TaxID=1506 RepID=UPI0039F5E006
MMKLSFKLKPVFTEQQLAIIEGLSYHTTKLYNIVNYDFRENAFKPYLDIFNVKRSILLWGKNS